MIETVLRVIRQHQLIPSGSLLVVGVSGGADSLALLHLLHQLAPRLECRLHAVTLDHGLRGEDGAADAAFVVQTAAAWGIAVTSGRADVRQLASREKLSIEAAARQARYDFLAQMARELGAARVAVAHHADDQAETILLHLVRGAGLAGLRGMGFSAPLPGQPDLILIRPLLTVSRADIEAYCAAYGLSPRADASNDDLLLARNRLRHAILPQLERLNPQVRRALVQLGDAAALEDDYITAQFNQMLVTSGAVMAQGRASIPRAAFVQMHPALRRRWLIQAFTHVSGTETDLSYNHIVSAIEIGQGGRLGARALLPGGLHLRVDYDRLVIEYVAAPPPADLPQIPPHSEIPVEIPGQTPLPDGRWVLEAAYEPLTGSAPLQISRGTVVSLRTRRSGDRFAPQGLQGHTQKVSRWLVNHKVPLALRDGLPLLVAEGQIAAIFVAGGWAVSAHFAVKNAAEPVVHFNFRQNP